MANVYVDSNAVGAGTGADWANAFTTLNAALTAKAAGDSFWVANNHAETAAAAKSHLSPGTVASPCLIACVSSAGSVPPVSADLRTTATISTTGANGINFTGGVVSWCYGITFRPGSLGNTASCLFATTDSVQWRFDTCGFTLNNTSINSRFNLCSSSGGTGIRSEFKNCTFTFGSNTGQGFTCSAAGASATAIYGGSVVVGANVPTSLFLAAPPILDIIGMDLSALGSGKTLIAAALLSGRTRLQDCALGASVTVAATPTSTQQETYLIRSDSSGTNYRHEKYTFAGTQTVETTIVRTGGASDGTTPISWKIVSSANSKFTLPYESLPIAIWNDTISPTAITVTVYGIWGGGAVPNNDDIWMEIEYLGSSLTPIATLNTASTKADNLATGTPLASDTSTWGGSTTKFKITATFTPQQKGWLAVVVKAALASSTFYIDPLVVVT